jgi:hypothetical protein
LLSGQKSAGITGAYVGGTDVETFLSALSRKRAENKPAVIHDLFDDRNGKGEREDRISSSHTFRNGLTLSGEFGNE